MNEASGFGEVQVGEETLKVKFGLNAFQLFCQHRKVKLSEMGEALGDTISIIELSYFAHTTEMRLRGKEPYLNLTQFVEMVNDGDTTAFITKVNEILLTAKLLGKTVDEWDKKKV